MYFSVTFRSVWEFMGASMGAFVVRCVIGLELNISLFCHCSFAVRLKV